MTTEELVTALKDSIQGIQDIIDNAEKRGHHFTASDLEEEQQTLTATFRRWVEND